MDFRYLLKDSFHFGTCYNLLEKTIVSMEKSFSKLF